MLNMSENCQPSGKVFIAKSFSKNKFDRKKKRFDHQYQEVEYY